MSISLKDLDAAFQGSGQKAGLEIWRIENFRPARVPDSSHGKFYMGDSYIVLKTTALKSGALRHDIHYWLGKDTSQDEAGAAAIKTVELDAALGGRAVQYREVQGHETEKFLSYFKPCIIPLEGGIASGFKHHEAEEYKPRLYVCQGKHVVHVNEVPCARSTLSHDDIFILDTESKIFQFNGSNSSIQERAKALEVVQYIKDNYHHGKCDIASIEDGRLMADVEAGEFWGFFGGFAPLPRKSATDRNKKADPIPPKLYNVEKGQAEPVEAETLTRDLLTTDKCYLLDCGTEVFVWIGRTTSLDERNKASEAAEELLRSLDRPKSHIIRIIEGFETAIFRSKFDSWPETAQVAVSEDGRGKVAALLKRQGVNVKGLVKSAPAVDEPQPYIDCSGNLQVWRVNGDEKTLLSASEQSKFYSGDCYIFQYSYPGEDKEEYLIGTWFGTKSIEDEQTSALALASKMVESMKFLPSLARFYEGSEPIQFFAIFQSFVVFKGGVSEGYKKYIAEQEIPDDTYTEDGVALFRIQGSGPENMQAIQVDVVPSSLNSSYCYILHSGTTVFTWSGNLTSPEHQELVERQLDIIKPNLQSKTYKEGAEPEPFWQLLGEKTEYSSEKIARERESDAHLFSCSFVREDLKVVEIHNFTQDDLMTEDIYILDCHSDIFVWVGQQVDSKSKLQALTIGEKFVERDFLLEKLSPKVPIYVIMEGNEPSFFTRFFTWDSAKSGIHGNSFQRKLSILKNGGAPAIDKPKRRNPVFGGRSGVPDKSNRSRSMSSSPDRARVRGRSPAFTALAATFENSNTRNLSTPPPMIRKLYPKSGTPESSLAPPKSTAIAALTASFDKTPTSKQPVIMPRSRKETPTPDSNSAAEMPKETSMDSIQEDIKEDDAEEDEGLTVYPYDRLTTTSEDPAPEIDLTRREAYLSAAEFKDKFGMAKDAFYKLPKWKQNKLKTGLQLF
ncbi:villin-4-like [Silene latifolia]|uniref:villin-4-like n=1 Tax=Silene latifolia TaxID=37657 RepID=UPI003D77F479